MLCGGVRPPSGSQEGFETEVCPRADLISSGWSRAQRATEVLGQEFLDQISPEGPMVMFHCEAYNLVPRGTQMPYSAVVDLVAGLGASQVVSERSMFDTRFETLDFRQIVPEKEPIPVIDLFDDGSVEGPETAPMAPRIGLGISIEEDPSKPTSDSEMMPEERERQQQSLGHYHHYFGVGLGSMTSVVIACGMSNGLKPLASRL
ncbi:hypothetical protein M9H77_21640 [Catharanthus roseus]|uniref:Uncharacterized protein n=1 Tax=Catharanthus roseus TaxID=4058 RepID=A0ACC0APE3_CATRO|nr:hypothetical protein M9H77_21640 [Catharanthus roseus]